MTTETRPGLHTLAQLQTRHSNATESGTVRIELPIPTSTNDLYEGMGRNRTISANYEEWQLRANQQIAEQGSFKRFERPVWILMVVIEGKDFNPDVRDMDNLLKATLDKLTDRGILRGDTARMIPKGAWEFIEAIDRKQPARCWVEIREAV